MMEKVKWKALLTAWSKDFSELNDDPKEAKAAQPSSVVEEDQALASNFEALSLQTPPNSVEKKKIKKSKEEVKTILVASIKNTDFFKDYTGVEIKTDTEKDCIETLGVLSKALIDAKKRIIYFSALQGQVLKELKDLTKCTMNALLKKQIILKLNYIF